MTSWQRQRLKKKATPVLAPILSCHSWNKDRSKIALSHNSSEILIYDTKKSEDFTKWVVLHKLTEHGKLVTCLSWAENTNRILSCSQDRNAYVWTFTDGKWEPVLVLLRIRRAATCCSWSQREDKFAVGSGQKIVSVCFFDDKNNWWVSKATKKGKHKSTVMSVKFHPKDNTMLLTGSADNKARYYSAFIKHVDKKEEKKGVLGKDFGEWSSKGWVLSVDFSPDGTFAAFVGHDSTITVMEIANAENVQVIRHKGLPFNSVLFLSNNAIAAGGFDYSPNLFCNVDGTWKHIGDVEAGPPTDGATEKKESTKPVQTTSRFGASKFGASKFGGSSGSSGSKSSKVERKHKNAIVELQTYSVDGSGNVSKFSSCGSDGRLLFWDTSSFKKTLPEFAL